jgi:Flp pilus assembly pilin Flp
LVRFWRSPEAAEYIIITVFVAVDIVFVVIVVSLILFENWNQEASSAQGAMQIVTPG